MMMIPMLRASINMKAMVKVDKMMITMFRTSIMLSARSNWTQ